MRAILIVQDRAERRISDLVGSLFDSFEVFTGNQDIISLIYMEPPDIILIDGGFLMTKGDGIVREFRSNTIFGNVPIVALLDRDTIDSSSWQDASIDDYLSTGEEASSIATRLRFIAKRSVRELDMNPLTRLPGNESIIRAIQGMLDTGEDIAIAWVDIDNFKPFNDRYGFSRGDEIIMATGRIITNAVREINQEKTFVGHIGGDDFVFMCPTGHVRQLCEEVLSRFDTIMKNFYNDEELDQGGIVSTGRDGTERKYPFMTLTIAVVLNEAGHYTHCGQAAQDATDIKKYLKALDGSNYMIDRRALKT
ncbi:MAG TPA: diguanylate cyclase [Deltaproteobacteria bacterium]|nr:diguanylate cyclase [Deltaproteobacteria bacterium]HPR56536.1 diguanylate cyclase [Deltaproteobacteria bacterium]HXK47969.1 diguanylate cyclase [Deltaproteobacteria bacterium]